MPRLDLKKVDEQLAQRAEAEVEQAAKEFTVDGDNVVSSYRPDHIDPDVWALIQENGQLATERLNEILKSPRFARYRPGDQAKLIQLAQHRAYGPAKLPKGLEKARTFDATAEALSDLAGKAALPEYAQKSDLEPEKEANPDEG